MISNYLNQKEFQNEEHFEQYSKQLPIPVLEKSFLKTHPQFEKFQSHFDIKFSGGAVMNTIQLLKHWNSCYCRTPKKSTGGCAIWDLAAVSLMVQEQAGSTRFFDTEPLHLNRNESIYFNDRGLGFASAGVKIEALLKHLNDLIS